jgi:hypothetical protein
MNGHDFVPPILDKITKALDEAYRLGGTNNYKLHLQQTQEVLFSLAPELIALVETKHVLENVVAPNEPVVPGAEPMKLVSLAIQISNIRKRRVTPDEREQG